MNKKLELLSRQIRNASCPEEVFGDIVAEIDGMLPILKQRYRAFVKVVHPDIYQDRQEKVTAQSSFRLLTNWLVQAERKINTGIYGKKECEERVIIHTATRDFEVDNTHIEDGIFNVYSCIFFEKNIKITAELRVVRDPVDNDLAKNEIRALQILAGAADRNIIAPYIPHLFDKFIYDTLISQRQAFVLKKVSGWHSLEKVHEAYPRGIDPKDMAWIWRRLLMVLGFSHRNGILHGAVLPQNICILPEEHGLMLINWSSALIGPESVRRDIPVGNTVHKEWYPQEVLKTERPMYPADILMSAKCMLWIIGGDPRKKSIPNLIPTPLKTFLMGCILPVNRSPQDAWQLLEEFDELLTTLWGPRTFHPFRM